MARRPARSPPRCGRWNIVRIAVHELTWVREQHMPDSRKHRGPGPKDPIWFGGDARDALRAAVADLSWLLSRGYTVPSALNLVGDRYQLVERQRLAVIRSA